MKSSRYKIKNFAKAVTFSLLFVTIFSASGFVLETASAQGTLPPVNCSDGSQVPANQRCPENTETLGVQTTPRGCSGPFDCALKGLVVFIAEKMLQLTSLLTGLSGILLNGVIYYTIVMMADNYSNLPAIAEAWGTIRDVANMGFIFILLYAAIRLILGVGSGTQKLIVNIVIVAILLNFSLFFTKLVIDVSNVLALTFYGSMVPVEALKSGAASDLIFQGGLSNAFMDSMDLSSLYKASEGGLSADTIITVGVMGSIMLLIAAFVFFAAAILFLIRYVVLILVLILSPIAFMAMVMPQLSKYKDQWWNALSGQAFFAPIYFMLIWISLKILDGMFTANVFNTSGGEATANLGGVVLTENSVTGAQGFFSTFIGFAVVIVFLIVALIVSKEWANKAGPGVSGMTKWAMGAAGGAVYGTSGFIGRQTIGRTAAIRADNQDLKDRAAAGGRFARLQLAASKKTAGSSFDFRASKTGKATVGTVGAGKAGGKGGFADYKKKQSEEQAKFAASLAPGDEVIDQAEQKLTKTKNIDIKDSDFRYEHELEQRNRRNEVSRIEQRMYKAQANGATPEEMSAWQDRLGKAKEREASVSDRESYKNEKVREAQRKVDELKGVDDDRAKEILKERGILNPTKEQISQVKKENKSAADRRKQEYANVVEKSFWGTALGYNKAAAAQIRKGKSKKERLAELAKDVAKEDEKDKGEEAEETTPPSTEEKGGGTSGGGEPQKT